MSSPDDLIKSIRSGKLNEVRALLKAGVPADLDDGRGQPGLPLAMACFLGHTEIVRELIQRGAKVNIADNSNPASPLSMALRGNRRDVVKLLIEFGVAVPESMQSSLHESELTLLRHRIQPKTQPKNQPVSKPVSSVPDSSGVEEIDMVSCYGTDTEALEADIMRIAREMAAAKKIVKRGPE